MKRQRKWVRVPVPPTPEMLDGMAQATFMRDGSRLEMERRFNGMLGALPAQPKQKRVLEMVRGIRQQIKRSPGLSSSPFSDEGWKIIEEALK